jgi:A/G-specific adenine glycosylase
LEVKTKNFKNVLLHWYKDNKREYAWRNNSDPWSIYLLEVISQQTQLDRADKYFKKFIKEFPTPNDMATTSFKKVLEMWSGLGYNSRAKRMFESSKIIAEKSFDDLYPDFQQLPGVGPYTENAILSFAYNEKVITEDTNVKRIISRYFGTDNPKKYIDNFSSLLLQNTNSRNLNQAFMDFGSSICKPRGPLCSDCPLEDACKKYFNYEKRPIEKFSGSNRELRGKLIKLLLKKGNLNVKTIQQELDIDQDRLNEILKKMQKDGLVKLNTKNLVEINHG